MPSNWVQAQPVAKTVLSSLSRASIGGRGVNTFTTGTTGALVGSSNILLMPLANPTQFSIRRIFWLNSSTVAGNVEVAIYDLDGRQLVTSGSTAMSGANSFQGVAKSYELPPGNYWLAFASNSATATFPLNNGQVQRMAARGCATHVAASPLPMPSTITPAACIHFAIPICGVSSLSTLP